MNDLFAGNTPEEHWLNMPEFKQEKQEPFACLNLRFETEEDMKEFCKLTGLKLTSKTKSAWFPEKKSSGVGSFRWV